jgi:peptidoglycan hydrolase-like protein with peptidoglycan-binding domain
MTTVRPLRRLVRVVALGGVAVAAVAAVTVTAVGVGGVTADSAKPKPLQVRTATVTRKTLVDVSSVEGKLGYGAAVPISSQATGTVTWLPDVGTVVSRGKSLLRVDDQPVTLLYGALPMYRQLTTGTKGEDVKQFEQNLNALGYTGFTVDTEFSAATATAVKRWQKALKRPDTGTVGVAEVIFAAGPLRVAKQPVRVGAKATAEVLMVTSTKHVVAVEVPAEDQRLAKVHNTVTVTLPDGRQVNGEVTAVGVTGEAGGATAVDAGTAVGSAGAQPAEDTTSNGGAHPIPAVVDVADQEALAALDATTVTVQYVAETHPNVLTVPVQALLALEEGGYGLEIRDGARRVVAVKVGLFAGGQVEVSGDGITEGTTVGVAE